MAACGSADAVEHDAEFSAAKRVAYRVRPARVAVVDGDIGAQCRGSLNFVRPARRTPTTSNATCSPWPTPGSV